MMKIHYLDSHFRRHPPAGRQAAGRSTPGRIPPRGITGALTLPRESVTMSASADRPLNTRRLGRSLLSVFYPNTLESTAEGRPIGARTEGAGR
jgi:hypothetical protein